MKKSVIDIFSGCGGLSIGLSQAGFEHVFALEKNQHAFQSYFKNIIKGKKYESSWPNWLSLGPNCILDVINKHREELLKLNGQITLLAGGPPCQGFSMNGKRDQNDPRNLLVNAYFEFAELIRPKIILLENVRGFASMSHSKGALFPEYAKETLDALGYHTNDKVLYASDWGVPQKRPRYFLIGFHKEHFRNFDVFEMMEKYKSEFFGEVGLPISPTNLKSAIGDLKIEGKKLVKDVEFGNKGFYALDYRVPKRKSKYLKYLRRGSYGRLTDLRLPRHRSNTVQRFKFIQENCENGKNLSKNLRKECGLKKRSMRLLDETIPAPTITTLPDDFIHYDEPRILTVREMARIQSFPDHYSFCGPYTTGGLRRKKDCPRYTQVGNAVPPLLARAIGFILVRAISDHGISNLANCCQLIDKDISARGEIGNSHIDTPIFV